LGWGIRKNVWRHDHAIANLLGLFRPSVVVIRRVSTSSRRDTPRARKIARIIRNDARRHAIPVVSLGDRALKNFFRAYGKKSKYDIAVLVTLCFPELKWKLPPRRKIWMPEHERMSIFDAAQLGILFLVRQAGGDDIRNLLSSAEPFHRSPGGAAK
jgi:hypothetical protein